jgi:hypothetical protein
VITGLAYFFFLFAIFYVLIVGVIGLVKLLLFGVILGDIEKVFNINGGVLLKGNSGKGLVQITHPP